MDISQTGHEFRDRVATHVETLSPREHEVTEFLLNRPSEAVTASAAELAQLIGTSDATVVRTAQKLGYPGLRELKRSLLAMLTARRDPALVLDLQLERLGSTGNESVLERVMADSVEVLRAVPRTVDPDAWSRAVALLENADRVLSYGIGPAAGAAHFFALQLNRLGRHADAVETTGFRLADVLLRLGAGEIVVIHAPLRLFREIEVLLEHAREVGAPVIVITEAIGDAVADRADVVLTTPPSTTSTAGEYLAGWSIAHALVLELGLHDRSSSVASRQRLNQLRREIAGDQLDIAVSPGMEPSPDPDAGSEAGPNADLEPPGGHAS